MAKTKSGTGRKKSAGRKNKPKRNAPAAPASAIPTDPRAAERVLFDLHLWFRQQDFESEEEANRAIEEFLDADDEPVSTEGLTPVQQAQAKMYEAWAAQGKRRVELARKALELSPLCADAYVLLAQETSKSPEAALELYETGTRVGEEALGRAVFKEEAGRFWAIVETRPYMRARAGLVECLASVARYQEAMDHCRELLRLDVDDNQRNRSVLAWLFLKQGMHRELGELLDRYDDPSAEWAYTRALWLYRREGGSELATARLRAAFKVNAWVPVFALGLKRPPKRPALFAEIGDESEALNYLQQYSQYWSESEGAQDWFIRTFRELRGEPNEAENIS